MTPTAIPPFRAAALALALLIVAACGAPSGTPSPSAGPASPAASPTATDAPGTPSPDPTEAPSTAPASPSAGGPDLSTAIGMEDVATGFDQPIAVSPWGDGSGRLLVAEQPGIIRLVVDGESQPRPVLDIRDRISAGGERGLLGMAVPDGFGPDSPWLYVHYSGTDDGQTVVSAFRLGDGANPNALDPGSEQVVFTTPQPYPNHNGGYIGFDASGMLLVALGDGGAGGDPENRASDLGEPLGKVLRLDVGPVADGDPYAIPADNPFADDPDALPEILHYGLRNPFRANVDPATGDLWIGDVGQGAWEEVDVARAGASGLDFGWRRWEGRHCYNPATDCDPDGVTMPVTEYGHGLGCSVIGGVVYHGAAMPGLDGAYLFADYCSGTLWGIDAARDDAQEPATLLETQSGVSAIALDEDSEVLMTLLPEGRVVRLVPAP